MKTFVKQLALVALALSLHSALYVESQATTTTTTTISATSTTKGLPPVAGNTTTATTTTATSATVAPSTTARPIRPSTTHEPIALPDDMDAKGGVLQVKGMLEVNGLRWLLGGDSVFDGHGDSVFNGAERVLPLALTLLPLLGLMF